MARYDPVTDQYYDSSGRALAPAGTLGGVLPGASLDLGGGAIAAQVAQASAIAKMEGQYSGLGIFPWETPAGEGFQAPWTPKAAAPGAAVQQASLLPAIPAAAGIGATLATIAGGLGTAYGIAQGLGVQFPWETGPGEGFIAPWTETTKVNGKYVTSAQGGIPGGVGVAYTWNTGTAIFYRLTDGRIAVQKKNGVWKVYRPKKHLVIPTNISKMPLGKLIRAERMIDKLLGKVAKSSKSLKRQK